MEISRVAVFSNPFLTARSLPPAAPLPLDLPRHDDTSNSKGPGRTYTMPGYAEAAIEIL
jgi:hypothetical protein